MKKGRIISIGGHPREELQSVCFDTGDFALINSIGMERLDFITHGDYFTPEIKYQTNEGNLITRILLK